MIKILNETKKRNIDSVMDAYPNCEYIMAIDDIDDEDYECSKGIRRSEKKISQ